MGKKSWQLSTWNKHRLENPALVSSPLEMLMVQKIHSFPQGRGHGRLWKARTRGVGSLVRGLPAGRKGKRARGPGGAGGQEGTKQVGDLEAEAAWRARGVQGRARALLQTTSDDTLRPLGQGGENHPPEPRDTTPGAPRRQHRRPTLSRGSS